MPDGNGSMAGGERMGGPDQDTINIDEQSQQHYAATPDLGQYVNPT